MRVAFASVAAEDRMGAACASGFVGSCPPGPVTPAVSPRTKLSPCPELDCIRDRLPPGLVAAAELRSAEVGLGADRALIASDIVSEEAYLSALAADTGMSFENFETLPLEDGLQTGEQLLAAATHGILPISRSGELRFILAPRALAARRLVEAIRSGSLLAGRFSITTAERLRKFITQHAATAIAQRAADDLRRTRPDLSAGSRMRYPLAPGLVFVVLSLILVAAPAYVMTIFSGVLGLFFLAWAALRIIGPVVTRTRVYPRCEIPDASLPVYTIVVALYREAAAVNKLVASLRRLDYPGIMAQTPQEL